MVQFVFLGAAPMLIGPAAPQLVLIRCNERGEVFHLSSCPVTPLGLARVFYTAFRAFVESPVYHAEEWEMAGMDPEAGPWCGEPLRALRSPLIEGALRAADGKQLPLDLRFPRS